MPVNEKPSILVVVIISFLLALAGSATSQEIIKDNNEDSLVRYHFSLLQQAVKMKPKDTVFYCCPSSIVYIGTKSKIFSKADGTLAGQIYFTKSDFIKWKNWYYVRTKRPQKLQNK